MRPTDNIDMAPLLQNARLLRYVRDEKHRTMFFHYILSTPIQGFRKYGSIKYIVVAERVLNESMEIIDDHHGINHGDKETIVYVSDIQGKMRDMYYSSDKREYLACLPELNRHKVLAQLGYTEIRRSNYENRGA